MSACVVYPAQTSMMPVHIALARFLESQGWRAIFQNYPYWYLGTTPFRYLTGPVLPSILLVLHRLLPQQSLFEMMFLLIAGSWVLGAGGVYLLVKTLMSADPPEADDADERGFTPLLAAVFYAFGPIVPFLFRFSDGLHLIAFSFLPYILLLYVKFLGEKRGERVEKVERVKMVLLALIVLVILLDTSIIPSMLLGMLSVFLAQVGWRKAEEKIKQTFYVLLLAFLISTVLYSPVYWWQLLVSPSFAGKSLFNVIGLLSQLLPIFLALILAVLSGKFIKLRNLALKFAFYWLFIFGFLTLVRFISDPDFWLDWSAYATELQLGLAVLGALVLNRMVLTRISANRKRIYANPPSPRLRWAGERMIILVAVVTLVGISWGWVFNKYVVGTLQRDISQTVEYRIGEELSEITKPGEKVLLSGTTTFWINAFFDIPQVRGGKDEVSAHPTWRKAVWEIREGTEPEKSVKWLKDLDVSYLVVHSSTSSEYYHDFKYPEKFENAFGLEKIYEDEGDRIYRRR